LRVSSAPLLARLWPLLAKARLVISVEGSWALRMTRPPPDTYRQSCLAIICGLGGITTPVDAAVPNFPAGDRPTTNSVYAIFRSICLSCLQTASHSLSFVVPKLCNHGNEQGGGSPLVKSCSPARCRRPVGMWTTASNQKHIQQHAVQERVAVCLEQQCVHAHKQ